MEDEFRWEVSSGKYFQSPSERDPMMAIDQKEKWSALSLRDLPYEFFWRINLGVRSPKSFRYLRELKNWQHLSPESIAHKQMKYIKNLVQHAFAHSPYYRERIKKERIDHNKDFTWDVFQSIPIIVKGEIQEHLDHIVSSTADRAKLILDSTGGSTGEPLIFYHDDETKSWFEACDILVKSWWGIRPWCRKAFLWGADRDTPNLNYRQRIRLRMERSLILNSFDMTPKKMDEFYRLMIRWEPEYIQGYASSLFLFSKYLQGKGLSLPKPKAIRSTAETLFPVQRELIAKTLGENIYNFYGSREIPNIASECREHKGLHVISPLRYVEILDRNGNHVRDGETGRIVITDLVNYSMPLIRYEIGDIGRYSTDFCRCGNPFPLIGEVQGRISDFLLTRSGSYVHGEFFTHLFYGIPHVRKFQIVQKAIDRISLSIVVDRSDVLEPSIARIRQAILEKMGEGTEISVSYVQDIPPTKTGKFRFTISEVKGLNP